VQRFVHSFCTKPLLSQPTLEHLEQTINNLLTSGCIEKSVNDFIQDKWANLTFTPFGRIVAGFDQDETATCLMMVGNLLMIQETGIIIGAQQTFQQRDMFKEEMGSLSLTRDKLKWSLGEYQPFF
jgi:hypothetical protein